MSLSVVDHCGDHFEYLVNFFGYADNLWSSMNFYSEILVVQKSYQSTLRQFYKSYISFKVSYTRVPDYSIIYEFTNKRFAWYNFLLHRYRICSMTIHMKA